MCASNVQAPLPPSALRRPDSAAAGAADDPATPRPSSACSPSPKRVSFALPPAAESRLAAAAALLHVAADGSASPVRRPSRLAATAALDAAAEFLSFMPDVDLPGQAPLAPLTVPSLASARRWPSNNVSDWGWGGA